jgi:hypothetical protein
MTKEPYVMVSISAKSNYALKLIAANQGFKNKLGDPSRAQAVEYLIKNFFKEAPIA